MSSQSIQNILNDLNQTYQGEGSEKTASDNSDNESDDGTEKIAKTKSNLESSLNDLLNQGQNMPQEKTASQTSSASTQVEKIANDLAQSDLQATVKEAQLFGAAVFDSFISRANQHAQSAGNQVKTASYDLSNGGYGVDPDAAQQMQKQASQQGYNEAGYALELMEKEAHSQGYRDMNIALDTIANSERQKVAHGSREQGMVDALEKIAALSEDCFNRGFQTMNALSQSLR